MPEAFTELQGEHDTISAQNSPPRDPTERRRSESADSGSSKVQTQSKRFVFATWRDRDDHELCTWALVDPPERAPFQGRTGVATARWVVSEVREGRQLMCNKLHDGPCEWPWDVAAGWTQGDDGADS